MGARLKNQQSGGLCDARQSRTAEHRMRDLFVQIQKLIIAGNILSCTKVKWLPLGKCELTLGKYRTAVPQEHQKYALFINNEPKFFPDAASAARYFIDFAGRPIATDAYKRVANKAAHNIIRARRIP